MSPLMTCHYPDLGSASNWLIIALSRLKVVGRHQCRSLDLAAFSSDVISWCHEMSAVFHARRFCLRAIRSTTEIKVVRRHQYGI